MACDDHGAGQPVYVVCVHVAEKGAQVEYIEHPEESGDGIGTILCGQEHGTEVVLVSELTLVCRSCAREAGWVK